MSKKSLTLIILLSSFALLMLLLVFIVELIGYHIFGGADINRYLFKTNETINSYRMFSYGAVVLISMHCSLLLYVLLCSKNKLGLSIDIAIELLDDENMQKLYLKKWIKK